LTEGIILLDKPAGQTSFQSLGFLKHALGTGRVGHAGTLDKFAEGLLVVLAGRMTRLCPFATSLDKEYLAVFRFGQETDTLDPEGAVIAEGPVPSRDEIEASLHAFRGAISQVPPAYSAIHVDGRRASEAARSGQEVQLKPRQVTVQRLELLDYDPPEGRFRICCSKGTYVRSLARDIAVGMGTRAHVRRLRRTRIGGFLVENAHTPESLRPAEHILPPAAFFSATPALGRLSVRDRWAQAVSGGIRLEDGMFEEAPAADGVFGAFAHDERLLAVIERTEARLRYLAAFPENEATAAR
jgi:tRNA pseudouridine55 synthase